MPLTRSVEIVVNQPKRPTIVSFTADSSKLRLGQTTALRWTVLGASEVRIDPGIGLVEHHRNCGGSSAGRYGVHVDGHWPRRHIHGHIAGQRRRLLSAPLAAGSIRE